MLMYIVQEYFRKLCYYGYRIHEYIYKNYESFSNVFYNV